MISRLGNFCFRRRWWVLAAWVLVMIAGSFAIGPVLDGMGDTNNMKGTEASHARDAMKEGIDRGVEFIAVVDNVDPLVPATGEVVNRALNDVKAIPGVKEVAEPRTATDKRAVAITVVLAKAEKQAVPFRESTNRLKQLSNELPGATVQVGGGELISPQANDAVDEDLQRAELFSLPLTAIVLLFVFGGVIAAGLPILAAVGTMLGAFASLLGFSAIFDLDANVITVITLLGLGLSIDYGLLLVARYREELAATDDRAAAVERAWRTAGRTIAFSALTVAAALTGLAVFDVPRLQAMAAAGISAALVAMLAGLTLTAALIGLLGKWVKPGKRDLIRQAASRNAAAGGAKAATAALEKGFFARLAKATQRRPVLVVLGSLVVLLAIAAPVLHVNVKVPQLEGLPRSIESVRVADQLDARFGQTSLAAVRVVARADPATLDAYAAKWTSDPEVLRVEKARPVNPTVSAVVIATKGDGQSKGAQDLVNRLRTDRPAGVESWVAGDAAQLIDLNQRLADGLPLGIAITALAMILLLFLMTGSLIIPLKAIAMNVISLGATFGVLVAVFQDGFLAGPLDTLTVGGLSPYMIVVVFAFAFGLSMDYEVFLLGRIKEYVDAGEDSDTAVRHGLQDSGRIITSAAMLMLIVFAFFAAAKVGQVEQIGLGLFVAVLVDATIVRCLLVPATMTLLGKAAWWAPRPLKRLHDRIGLREASTVEGRAQEKVSVD